MKTLIDFPSVIVGVKTMVDNSIRLTLELPETESDIMSQAHKLKREQHYLRVVIYDDDEFQTEVKDVG